MKILVLTTGGTIASTETTDGLAPGLSGDEVAIYFGTHLDVELTVLEVMSKDSTNMQPEDWLTLANVLKKEQDHYDGFIITHGTDTMAYTSSALSYLLHDFKRPIALTGSQIPLGVENTDAIRNLKDALTFVSNTDLVGVYVVFNGLVIVGTRAIKTKSKSYDAFESINYPYIASVADGEMTELYTPSIVQLELLDRTTLALDTDIFVLKAFPGMTRDIFDYLAQWAHGVIIESFGNGGLPFQRRNLLPGIQQLVNQGIPVIITTQILEEGQDIELYEVGQRVADAGGITAKNMNTEAIVAKLMWVLAQTRDMEEVKQFMHTPIAYDLD